MRRKPPGLLLPSAHAVDREFRVITALGQTDVPVARTHVLCEDPAVIGTAFYIMDCVDGRVLWDPTLPGMGAADFAGQRQQGSPLGREGHVAHGGREIQGIHLSSPRVG